MKKYPIQYGNNEEYLPYDMMLEHETQCLNNHGQTVERLAERKGTSYLETLWILLDSKFEHIFTVANRKFDISKSKDYKKAEEYAKIYVCAMAYRWLMNNKQLN